MPFPTQTLPPTLKLKELTPKNNAETVWVYDENLFFNVCLSFRKMHFVLLFVVVQVQANTRNN